MRSEITPISKPSSEVSADHRLRRGQAQEQHREAAADPADEQPGDGAGRRAGQHAPSDVGDAGHAAPFLCAVSVAATPTIE